MPENTAPGLVCRVLENGNKTWLSATDPLADELPAPPSCGMEPSSVNELEMVPGHPYGHHFDPDADDAGNAGDPSEDFDPPPGGFTDGEPGAPARNASTETWRTWAVDHGGLSTEEAEAASRDDLADRFNPSPEED